MLKQLKLTDMKKITQTILSIIFILLLKTSVLGQCAFGGVQYPSGTLSSPPTTFTTVSTCIYGGEYQLYNVVSGTQYEWSYCSGDGAANAAGQDMQLTLFNNGSGAFLAYSDDVCGLAPKITWTATFTGTVRMLTNLYYCGTNSTCHTLVWRSVSVVPPAPTAVTATSTNICSGASTTLTASGPVGTVYWFAGGCNTTGQIGTGTSISVSPATTTTYYARNFSGGQWSTTCTAITITVKPNPTVNAGVDITACNGQVVQLNGTAAGTTSPGTLSVTISGTGFLDETSWTLTNSLGVIIGSGGPYGLGTTNVIPIGSSANGPYSLYVETTGTFNDNIANYSVSCNASIVSSGVVNGGGTTTQSIAACGGTFPVTVAWSPATGLSSTTILNPTSTVATTTTYTLTATSNGCSASDQVILTRPTAGSSLGNNNESASCIVNQNGWIHFYHSSGRLLASINSLGQNLGNVTVTSYVDVTNASVPACGNTNPAYNTSVMQRHWVITPTIQPASPVQVRLPYSNAEFLSLTGVSTVNANPNDDVFIPADVKLNKYSGPLNVNANPLDNCLGTGGSGGTTQHDPIANGVATVYSTVGSAYYSEFSIPGFSEFWLNGNLSASPLPVELTSFQANCTDDQKVELTWTTASEHNSSHFVVERTVDGAEWSQLATVQSAGNSNSLLTYSIIDSERSIETIYYRLTQVDFDGQTKVYEPVSINCGDINDKNSIRTYPNPSNSDFYIEVNSSQEVENVTLKILDSHGALLKSMDIKLNKGITLINLENNTFAPGMYYIMIENDQVLFEKSKHTIH